MAINNSFYGGRRGASFVIVKNYLDIPSMTTDFAQGNSFKDVSFDEYVLINNPNKNHPDNGKIFRRGYDYNSNRKIEATVLVDSENHRYQSVTEERYKNLPNGAKFLKDSEWEAHGAEYIGTIIGPSGKAPLLTMTSYEDAQAKQASNFETRKSNGMYSPNVLNPGLIPGKEGNTYHDSIQWYCTSIRNDNYGDDTEAFIGFKFPYLVTQWQTQQVEPYDKNGNINDTSKIQKIDDGTHPYYNKWHLDIPKGIKGDTFKNLKVTTYRDWLRSLNNSGQRVMYKVDSSVYSPAAADQDKQILIYEDWNYDNKQAGQVIYYYLGDYNQIKNMTLNNGVFTITFTHDGPKTFTFDYVKDVKINNRGYLQFDYSLSGKTKEFSDIKWIDNIQLDVGEEIIPEEGDPYWNVNPESTGKFEITYNDGTKKPWYLPMVSSINYDDDNGNLSYSLLTDNLTPGAEEITQQRMLTTVKYIHNIVQEEMSGVIFIIYNTLRSNIASDNPETVVSILSNDLIKRYRVGEGEEGQTDKNNIAALRTIAENIGSHEYSVFPIKAITDIRMEDSNIIAKYTTGVQQTVGQGIYGITKFEYDPETSSLIIQRSMDNEATTFTLNYPETIRYDYKDDVLKYDLSNGQEKTIGNLPLIRDLSISDSLDLYVQMNGSADAAHFITESEDARQNPNKYYDENHSKNQNWVHLGNLSKITNVIGVARNFTWQDLKAAVNDNPTLSEDSRLELFRTSIFTIYTEADAIDVVTIALNVLYPNGEITDLDEVDGARYRAVTVGNSEDLKDFYAYDWGASSWFFLGRIETAKNTAVDYKSNIGGLPSSGGILLTRTSDICQISIAEDNGLQVKNNMKEIKIGKSYYNYIYNTDATNSNIEIIMNGDSVPTTMFDESTRQINIPQVTGDIEIRKIS